jgi:nucleotide-binding universal stress UspA family protein
MFSRALVATDLSPSSEALVSCAGSLSALGVREAVLVYVIDLANAAPATPDDAAFERQLSSLETAGIRVRVETPVGYAPYAIAELAERYDTGLVVMGSHGKGLFTNAFSGSVSSDVVRLTTTPVLLAPAVGFDTAEAGRAACERLLASVLVPTEFSPASERAFRLSAGLADRMGSLELLHVVESTLEAVRDGRESHARRDLDILARRARDAGANDVRVTIVSGTPDRMVAERASSGDYTLVILAPRCQDTADRPFGSVADATLQTSVCPVLLSPPNCVET